MSAQSTISDRSAPGLIETMLFTREEGIVLLNEHLARLSASARHFGFPCAVAELRTRLSALTLDARDERLRLRLVLGAQGDVTLTSEALAPPKSGLVWRVALAEQRFDSAEPLLRHKTTLRDRYERPLAQAGTNEVVFLNERGELCEGARSNLFISRGEKLLTPTLTCGLLPGTLRAWLLATGKAEEAVLTVADLLAAETWFMGNSVRGLVRARLQQTPIVS